MRRYSEVMDMLNGPELDFEDGVARINLESMERLLGVCDLSWGIVRSSAFGSFITVMAVAPDRERARAALKELLLVCLDSDRRITGLISSSAKEGVPPEPSQPIDLSKFIMEMKEMGQGMGTLGVEVIKDILLLIPWSWMSIHQFLALASGILNMLPSDKHKAVVLEMIKIHETNVGELSELLESRAMATGPSLDMAVRWVREVEEWMKTGWNPWLGSQEGVSLVNAVTKRFGAPWAVSGEAPV